MTMIGAWLIMRIVGPVAPPAAQVTRPPSWSGAANGPDPELEKRAATIVAVFRLVIGSTVWAIALVMVLVELGFKDRASARQPRRCRPGAGPGRADPH